MSIPLYFVANHEIFDEKVMQLGYGLYSDGTIRAPQRHIKDVPIVIDDANTPKIDTATAKKLCALGECGIYFDFERPFCEYHAALLAEAQRVTHQIWLPEGYRAENALPVCACPRPCNRWEDFAAAAQVRHPNGWALEIVPWYETVPTSLEFEAKFLENAVCMAEARNGLLRYFDTHGTLFRKIKAAEQFGCRSAICLHSEWQQI